MSFSCYRYELRNSIFKKYAHATSNFINICKTLIERNAAFEFDMRLTGEVVRDTVDARSMVPIDARPPPNVLELFHSRELEAPQFSAQSVVVNGTRYCIGQYVVISVENGHFKFGYIKGFFFDKEWLFLVRQCDSVFLPHSCSYRLLVEESERLLSWKELANFRPVDYFEGCIRLKCWVF